MRSIYAAAKRSAWMLWPVWAWLVAAPAAVRADEDFAVPPARRDLPARWVFEVHLDGVVTLDTSALCPQAARCVYSGGAGVGATAEHRWPSGFGAYVGYDVWFIDSSSVYELGVQQTARGGVRYTWPTTTIVHPVFDLSGGFTVFGDTFLVDSVGVLLSGLVGLEFELSRHFGVLGGLGVRAFTHSRFTTDRDGVPRGRGDPFSETLFLQVALTINGRPWASAKP